MASTSRSERGHEPDGCCRPDGAGGDTLVPNPPAVGDLYVRDLQTQTTTLLDQTPSGQASDGFSTGQFVFSPDSTKLAWIDTSDNLTTATLDPLSRPTDAGELPTYVYVRDLAAQTTSLVSVSTSGEASGNITPNDTTDLVFSPDSQSLVFGSTATDLTTNLPDNSPNLAASIGEATNPENLFLRNLAAGTTTLLERDHGRSVLMFRATASAPSSARTATRWRSPAM